MRLALLLAIAGCAPDLTAAEQRQRQLERELAELDREIESLRASLEAAGIEVQARRRGRGKAKRKARSKRRPATQKGPVEGHHEPANERSGAAGVSVSRTGPLPALPAVGEIQRTPTDCGFKIHVPDLKHISDYPLNTRGLGKSGPVVVELDGEPLEAHAFPATYEKACSGAFRHAGTVVLFSPPDTPELGDRSVELVLDARVPMPRGDDGRPMYWVFPGTTLEVEIERWDPAWGESTATIAALATGPGEATLRIGGAEQSGSGPVRMSQPLEGEGPFEISIASPSDGPWVLLDVLTVGNDENAVVVTGGTAWRSP